MYDKDNSGSIELAEMIEIIGTLYEMEGVSKVSIEVIFKRDRYKNSKILKCSAGIKISYLYLGKCFRKSEKDFR